MKPFLRVLAAASMLAALSLSSAAQAYSVTFNTAGTIGGGEDSLGLFGTDRYLTGKKFTQSVTIDMAGLRQTELGVEVNAMRSTDHGAFVTGEVTVAGVSYTWKIDDALASARLIRHFSTTELGDGLVELNGSGVNRNDGLSLSAGGFMYTGGSAFLDNLDMAHSRNFITNLPDMYVWSIFRVKDAAGKESDFVAGGATSASWTVSNVPEPQTYAMLLLGIGLVGFTARRRRA